MFDICLTCCYVAEVIFLEQKLFGKLSAIRVKANLNGKSRQVQERNVRIQLLCPALKTFILLLKKFQRLT